MTMLSRTVPALLLCLAQPALAQTIDCANAMAQQELNFCAEQDWQAADVELNLAYREVVAEMRGIDEMLPPELQGAE